MPNIVQVNRRTRNMLGDLISGRPDIVPDLDPRAFPQQDLTALPGGGLQFQRFFDAVRAPTARVKELEYYDYLEREIADVRKALDAFSTMATTGQLAGGGMNSYSIRPVGESYPQPLLDRFEELEKLIQRNAYTTIRTMIKYGMYTPQIILGEDNMGKQFVQKLKPIPPGTIFRKFGQNGEVNPNKYWHQMIDGKIQGGQDAGIPQWVLPNFSLWSNVVNATETLIYGTSILQPFGAIGLKVNAAIDAMVVARLSRAAMRYKWYIDISDIRDEQEQIRERTLLWQRILTRTTSMLSDTTQNTDSCKQAPVPDADFFIPSAEGLKWDLQTISGDTNLARVGDVELLVRFYFGALGVPPEYLGHERSQGGRSNLSQVDINFARTTRHIQLFGASGFEHVVWVDMLLQGYDPRDYPIGVVPPSIGARDDLLQAQIRALQATVLATLRAAGFNLDADPRWTLRTFMNLDEELNDLDDKTINQLFGGMPEGEPPNIPDGQKKRMNEVLNTQIGDLMEIVRDNIRLLVKNQSALAPDVYEHNRPRIDELAGKLDDAA